MVGALIASLGVAFILAPNATFAGSRAMGYWPAEGYYYDPSYGSSPYGTSPLVVRPPPRDFNYTHTQDVPWDAVHRFPPMVAPSNRPYVQDCTAQTVTVPGRNGEGQTVNIMRCY